jgi:methylated-DNA-[protein]-cysteine S-methyltransferase
MLTRTFDGPLGPITLVADGGALVALHFEGEAAPPASTGPHEDDARVLAQAERELGEYFAGQRMVFGVKLAPRGTPFQERVWRLLREIPYGETRSYVDLARQLGAPNATRAVGRANGKNPIAILVPCHRVIGKDGSLTGFASGLHRKAKLLALEGSWPAQEGLFGGAGA